MGSRTWIKVYCADWLKTMSDKPLNIRGAWISLMVIAGDGKYGDDGVIKLTDDVGVPDIGLAKLLSISAREWRKLKSQFAQDERISVDKNNVITIINWRRYQPEYQRQKPYRERAKLQAIVTTESYKAELPTEIEIRDKRLEIENRDTPLNPPTVAPISQLKITTLEDVLDAFRENILLDSEATIQEDIEDDIKRAVARFSASWVVGAIKEAVDLNKRSWFYITGILKNWQLYGKDAKFPPKP